MRQVLHTGCNQRIAMEEAIMRVTMKGVVMSALMLGLSGAVYAEGAATNAGGGAGAGQGGNGMPTPNASGTMASPSDGMGSSHKPMKKQKKGAMGATASEGAASK